jgi:uncharacterized repeat protein (TIGR01451 family)
VSLSDSPDPAQPDEAVVYTFTYSNPGPGDLSGVVVHASYPAELTFAAASPAPDTGTTHMWTIGNLPAGMTGQIYIALVPTAPLPKGAAAQVRMWLTDGGGKTASALETTIFTADRDPYVVTITGVPRNPSASMTDVVYALRVVNVTSDTATDVRVTDQLPDGLTFINALPSPTTEAGTLLTWLVPSIAPGAFKQILMRATLDPGSVAGTLLQNQVTVTDDAGHLGGASFTGRVRGTAIARPALNLGMITVRRAFPGSQVRYNIGVKNAGSGSASDVIVSTTLPPQTSFVLSTPPPATSVNGVLTWKLGTLLASGRQVVRLTVKLDDAIAAGTVVTSAAQVSDAAGDNAAASTSFSIIAK